jgi:hypothetical protein
MQLIHTGIHYQLNFYRKKEVKNSRAGSITNIVTNKIKHNNELNNVQSDNYDYNEENIDFDKSDIETLVEEFGKIDKDTKYLMKYVKELEDIVSTIKSDLEILKEKEISRISKEFLINDYERRFKVNIETVLSAIVGHNNTIFEMKKIFKERNNYYESLKMCRNYDGFQSKYKSMYKNLFNLDEKGLMIMEE